MPETLQRGRSSFWEAEGQQGVPAGLAGSGCEHNLAMVRQKATLRQSFFPWVTFNKQAKQYPATGISQTQLQSGSPSCPLSLARDAVPGAPGAQQGFRLTAGM